MKSLNGQRVTYLQAIEKLNNLKPPLAIRFADANSIEDEDIPVNLMNYTNLLKLVSFIDRYRIRLRVLIYNINLYYICIV